MRPTPLEAFRAATGRVGRRRSSAGQSLTEFALVVPILLIVFVAIADFGRIFAAGVDLEAATRDAAEATANEYLSDPPGDPALTAAERLQVAAPGGNATYYDRLHTYAAGVVCAELRGLPNTNYDAGTNTCPGMPVVVVCVHDGADAGCPSEASPGSGIPAECGDLNSPAPLTSQQGTLNRWVEVRSCYKFTALLNNMPLFPFSEIWMQRTRSFTIPCYFALGEAQCGP
jgi:TadE-like protein